MWSTLDEFVATGVGFGVIAILALVLYRPAIQKSSAYQATVVPP